jgi:hypothetical protein
LETGIVLIKNSFLNVRLIIKECSSFENKWTSQESSKIKIRTAEVHTNEKKKIEKKISPPKSLKIEEVNPPHFGQRVKCGN